MFIAAGVFVYLLVFKLPFTPFLNEVDHHMFLYEGMRLFDGDVMYRDFFQFTFPGSQAWYWLMFSIFGLKYWILSATIVAIAVGSAWTCLKVSREVIGGNLFVIPTLLFIFFGFRWDGLDGTHRMFSPIFLMLAIWILLRRNDLKGFLLAGSFCAIASFFTQQRGVYVVAAIAVFLVADGLNSGKKLSETAWSIGAVAGSFLAALAVLCSYFIIAAGSGNFFAATLEYPAKYYHYAVYNNFGILALDLNSSFQIVDFSSAFSAAASLFYLFGLPLSLLFFWIVFLLKRKQHDWQYSRGIVLVALIGSVLTFTITAPNTSRLFQIAMPGLIVFVWLISYAKERFGFAAKTLIAATACFVLLSFIQAIRVQTFPHQLLETPSGKLAYNPSPIIDKRYKWLMERTKPGDLVFEAYQPYIYFPLLLRNPGRYGQIWDSNYTRPEHVAETIADLAAKRPRYILWNNDYNKPPEARSAGDHTAPLAEYLQQNYRPASDVIEIPEGRIQIWELK
ncbi:MAG: hypothetical protein QM785_19325 [Pyrinomonadaceae bacterium]